MSVTLKARKKQRKLIFSVMVLLLVIFTAAALLFSRYTGDEPIVYPDAEGIDKAAYEMELSLVDSLLGVKKNKQDTFSYQIKKNIEISASDFKGEALITNPIENNCLMAVEITLDGSDSVIYRSGYLKPNQRIDDIKLSEKLKVGEYDATVYFCAISFESYELLGILEENITLTVK